MEQQPDLLALDMSKLEPLPEEVSEVQNVTDNLSDTSYSSDGEAWPLESQEYLKWLAGLQHPLDSVHHPEGHPNAGDHFTVTVACKPQTESFVSMTTVESDGGSYNHWLSSLENNSVVGQQVAEVETPSPVPTEFTAAEQLHAVRSLTREREIIIASLIHFPFFLPFSIFKNNNSRPSFFSIYFRSKTE